VAFEFAGDGGAGEVGERGAVGRVVPVDGFDQGEGCYLDEVGQGFAAVAVPAGQVGGVGQVVLDGPVADALAVGVAGGQVSQAQQQGFTDDVGRPVWSVDW